MLSSDWSTQTNTDLSLARAVEDVESGAVAQMMVEQGAGEF